jgi:hypothetical protein
LIQPAELGLIWNNRLFQVKPSSSGCFKSSQAVQVVSSQARLCKLFQVKPISTGCFKSRQQQSLSWLETTCRVWPDLK